MKAELLLALIAKSLEISIDLLRVRLRSEGMDEVTEADLEKLLLDDPEVVIKRYLDSRPD